MLVSELFVENRQIDEITRISPWDYEGGKEHLDYSAPSKRVRPLPGGSGLLYSVGPAGYGDETAIKIWDPERLDPEIARQAKAEGHPLPGLLIGELRVGRARLPFPRAYRVNTINIDEDYRKLGLGRSLYGIALSQLGMTLIAGDSQTPGGRRAWTNLWRMAQELPLEVRGYLALSDRDLNLGTVPSSQLPQAQQSIKGPGGQTSLIDLLMGALGADYVGKHRGRHYFAFDVQPNITGAELESQIRTRYTEIYTGSESRDWSDDYDWVADDIGLYARWHGAQGQ